MSAKNQASEDGRGFEPLLHIAACPQCGSAIDAPAPQAVPEWPCTCDERGVGVPGVSCGDCPRDYGHKVKAPPAERLAANPSPWGRDDLMATAAVCYCLGRQTYIVGDCVDWLIAQQHNIRPTALTIILQDIREAVARDDDRERGDEHLPLGADFDRADWLRALRGIKEGSD